MTAQEIREFSVPYRELAEKQFSLDLEHSYRGDVVARLLHGLVDFLAGIAQAQERTAPQADDPHPASLLSEAAKDEEAAEQHAPGGGRQGRHDLSLVEQAQG